MGKDRFGNITKENLDKELDKTPGNKNYKSNEIEEEGIAVTFTKSNRSYLIDIDGNVIEYVLRLPEPTPEDSELATFEMRYGVIEVEFLNGKRYEIGEANEPILKDGMEGVYWTDSTGVINTSNPQSNTVEVKQASNNYDKSKWYQYTAQTGADDGKTSRWANATTSDGSYYVWIPRYAYRIVYFLKEEYENAYRAGTLTEEDALKEGKIVGYSDARGIVDAEGKRPTEISSTTSISVNDKYFRTHPVFDGNVDEGGWDSKLKGIWIMKYEASRNNATVTAVGNGIIPKSIPNVKPWVNTIVSTMFTSAKNAYNKNGELNNILNSHMVKNSEWGAVAYLAESKYGRNGTEISINQCSSRITGTGRGLNIEEDSTQTGTSTIYNSIYTWDNIKDTQKFNGEIGQLSSTTGNIYGIYDISGGQGEYVMGFLQDESGNIHTGQTTSTNSGFNGYLNDGSEYQAGIDFPTEKKYYQVYKNTTNNVENMDGSILGDAIKETKWWNSDGANFIYPYNPIFFRGGIYTNDKENGTFMFMTYSGGVNWGVGFRVCMCIL